MKNIHEKKSITRWEMSSNHNKNSHKSMFVPLAESAERSAYLGFEAEQSRTEVFDCKCICFSISFLRLS